VKLPTTLKTIGSQAFLGCRGFTSFVIPERVTSIGSYAFSDCINLASISVPPTVSAFGNNAFNNCGKLSIYSHMNSFATIYAIENAMPFIPTNDSFPDSPLLSLDRSKTSYDTNFSNISLSGSILMNLKYAIKKDDINNVSDMKVFIKLPLNTQIINSSLTVDGTVINNFTNDDNNLIIPVTAVSGSIKFSVKPTQQTNIVSYAQLSFKKDGSAKTEIIGIINEYTPLLTLVADDIVDMDSVPVSGIAPPESTVSLFVNNVAAGSVKASKAGLYYTTVAINNPVNYMSYEIRAESGVNSAVKTVLYQQNTPVLIELKMLYNGTEYDLNTNTGKSPIITFVSGKPFTFKAKFRNADMMEDVFIVSDRNNIKKYIKAEWDNNSNQYIASGFFDPSNKGYVPGIITVEYAAKSNTMAINEPIDFMEDMYAGDLTDALKQSQVEVIFNTPEYSEFDIKFSTNPALQELADQELKLIIKTTEKIYGSDFTGVLDGWEGAITFFDQNYWLNILERPDGVWVAVHDISSNKIIEYIIEFNTALYGEENWATKSLQTMSEISFITGMVVDYYGILSDDEKLRQDISRNPNLTTEQRTEALIKADELQFDRTIFLCLTSMISLVTISMAATTVMAGPTIVFGLLFGAITASSSFFWDMRMANIRSGGAGVSFNFRWAIDPSGYVYEAEPSNRLTGVKTTVYWKENDSDTPVIWDASEFNQYNPLYTDNDGQYAWDVPEGLWQVKYELDGYETAYSEWLPVPPPQTEVNIGMVSLAAPEVSLFTIYGSYAEVEFTRYMKPHTVGALTLTAPDGANIPYTLSMPQDETALDGAVYARRYILTYNNGYTATEGSYTLTTNENILSYAGKPAKVEALTAELEPGILISPREANVPKGGSLQFSATDEETGSSVAVEWTLIGNQSAGTSINAAGLLTIAEDESAETLTITATAQDGSGRTNTAIVHVVPTTTFLYGDVNSDGSINSSDHQRLFEHLNGTNLLAGDALTAGDVNKDGNINSSDHQRLFEHLNGTNPLS
jgi:hypothetical protein